MSRIFVGKLSAKTTEEDLSAVFGKYGDVNRIDVKQGYAFVFMDDAEQASDAIKALDGSEMDGTPMVVENARGTAGRDFKPKPVKRLDLRLQATGLDARISWQDLKDWAREAGDVTFTNVFMKDSQHVGVIEYQDAEGMETALRTLEDVPLKGVRIRLEKEEPGSEPRGRDGNSRDHSGGRGGDDYYYSREGARGSYGGRSGYSGADDYRGGGYSRGGYSSRERPAGGPGYDRGYPDRGDYPPVRGAAGYEGAPRGYGMYDYRMGAGYDSRRPYSDDYRRGIPVAVPLHPAAVYPPYSGSGGRARSRSRSRERGADPRDRFYGGYPADVRGGIPPVGGYAGGRGGYDAPSGGRMGYEERGSYGGSRGAGYYEGSRGSYGRSQR